MTRIANRRSAFTLTEVVVAAGLLVALMGIVAPLAVRCGQLWQQSRHQQLAIDELSNQLERLTQLDPETRRKAIDQLTPSAALQSAIPGASIGSDILSDEHGQRIVLRMSWGQVGGAATRTPLELVGWINPSPASESVEGTP